MANLQVFVIVLINLVIPAILQKCDERKDVVFLVDSSGSVKARNFDKVKSFLVYFVQKLDIGESKIRLSVVRFSSVLTKILWLDETFNKTEITSSIETMEYNGGGTKTGEALRYANEKVLNAVHGDREDVSDLVFVITDGKSKLPQQTQSEAKLLHDKGVDVVAIGVGRGVEDIELLNIASDKDFALKIDNFDQLKNETVHKRIFTAACTGLKPMTTTEKQETTSATESSTGNIEEIISTYSIPTEQSFELADDQATMIISDSTLLTENTTVSMLTGDSSIPTEQSFELTDDQTTMIISDSTLLIENTTVSMLTGDSSTSFDTTGSEQATIAEEMIIDDSTIFETILTRQTTSENSVTRSKFENSFGISTLDTTVSDYPGSYSNTSSLSSDILGLLKDWKTVAGLTAFSGLAILASLGGVFWAVARKRRSNSQEIKQYD